MEHSATMSQSLRLPRCQSVGILNRETLRSADRCSVCLVATRDLSWPFGGSYMPEA